MRCSFPVGTVGPHGILETVLGQIHVPEFKGGETFSRDAQVVLPHVKTALGDNGTGVAVGSLLFFQTKSSRLSGA